MVVLGAGLFHIFINSLKDRTERKTGQCDVGRSSQCTGVRDCYSDWTAEQQTPSSTKANALKIK